MILLNHEIYCALQTIFIVHKTPYHLVLDRACVNHSLQKDVF